MKDRLGTKCIQCISGKFSLVPFEVEEGEFVFCEACGFSMLRHDVSDTEEKEGILVIDRLPAIRYPMQPRHTNQYGTIFGGIVMSLIDQSAAVEARKHGLHRWVTASVDRIDFLKPIRVGDTISLYTFTENTGTSSVTVNVQVEVERYEDGEVEIVCSARVTMVSVGPDGKPIPFSSPGTIRYKT